MATDGLTTVKFQLVESDLKRVREILTGNRRSASLAQYIISYVILLPVFPFIPLIVDGRFFEKAVITGYLILLGLCSAFMVFVWRTYLRPNQVWTKSPAARRFLQATTISIHQKGVDVETPLTQAAMAWPTIIDISCSPDRQFVLLSLDQTQAIIIPARAFDDSHAMDCFIEEAQQLCRQYTGAAMLCPKCGYDQRSDPDAGCPECGWMRTTPLPLA